MTTNLVRSTIAAVLFFTSAFAVHAQVKLDDPLPIGPQVKVGKLANGLTYYIQKNGKPEKKLELRLVVKAGSILEDEDQQGLAHFTEHMAFNGTANFKKHELVSYLQSIGVKFGADLNAYTSFDETVYILPIPTDKKEDVEKGFLVLQDWAQGVSLNGVDIDQERAIVLEEQRLGKGAQDRMSKVLMPKIFNGSRYAQRLPIGKDDVLRNFKHDAIRRFYKDWYRPDLMAVVIVGDIEPAEAERLVQKHFNGLKNPARPRPRVYAPIPAREQTEALVVTDKEANGNMLLIRYPVKETREKLTLGGYRTKLVESLFTSMLNQRIGELAQQAEPPFLGASSTVDRLTARYKSFNAVAALGKGGAVPAIEALVQENARASQFGFTEAELERAKKNMMRSYERAYAERDKTDSSNYVGEYVRNFLEKESIPGIANEYNYAREMIPGITLGEMNRHARDTIPHDSSKLVVYMGATNTELPAPSTAQLLSAVAAAEKIAVSARNEKAVAANLMETPPQAGSIVEESEDKQLGLTRMTLSNGVKVVLKPTDFRNDQVIMSASRYGGQSLFDDADRFNARYAHALVGTMGLKDYSPVELQKILAGKSASVSTGMGIYTDYISGSSGSDDITTMLQFVYLKFTGARRDQDLFQSYVGKQVQSARNAMSQPEAVFQDTVVGTLYNNHPRIQRIPRPDDYTKLDLDRSIAIYKDRFSSARGMTFVIVGSFDIAKIRPLIATYLASLPTADIKASYRDIALTPVSGVVKKEVKSGTEAKSNISLQFTGDAVYSEEEQMRFHAMIDVINIRITDILREKLALIYGGGMGGTLNKVPAPHYNISVSLPTGPANVDKVLAAAFAEIERMKKQGPDAGDLVKVKQNWLQRHQKSMRENGYWLGRLQSSVLQGTDPATILVYEKRVNDITADDLRDAAKRYFNMKNYVQVVLYPEK